MRPNRLRRLVASTAAFTILLGTGIGWAADVHASPETDFLDGLTAHGMTIYNVDMALNTGWAICGALDTTTGDVVAENLYRITNGDVPDRYTAGVWVIEAVAHLCPWQQNGQGMPA